MDNHRWPSTILKYRGECIKRLAVGEVEGLLFGLKLGTLIPLIPPFYCQLFPSYRRICTEFRICATVHHSNLYPTDAALSFLSTINTPPNPPTAPPHPSIHICILTTIHSNIHFSFCSLFSQLPHCSWQQLLYGRETGSIGKYFAQRTIRTWRFTLKKLILILSIHMRDRGCAPLSLVVLKTAFKYFGLLRKLHLAIMKQSARVCRCMC